ncbi:MAG TPA: DUF2723 domain-containing protein, partial [Candidatus Hydrogenedentes bacterium]|nr:DUF2723 domain-containing protein [Candidatus Hydrogenedentota bacterium]
LALAFSKTFWAHAVVAEVYALNALLIALCTLLIWRWRGHRRDSRLYAFALVYGLGLANHNTMVLLGPVFAAYILWADGLDPARWRAYARAALLVLLGLCVYLYLPLASRANPPMDWGNPESLRGLWDHATRKQFSFMYSQYPRGLGRYLRQLGVCAGFWSREFTPPLFLVGVAGWWLLWRGKRAYAVFTLAVSVVVIAGFAFIQNFNFDKEWRAVMVVFGIPAAMMTAIWIGVALAWLREHVTWWAVAAAAAVCVFAPLVVHWRDNDKSAYFWAEDYARNVLESMALDAVYVSEADHASFPAVFMQAVEGVRPDVIIGRKYGYLSPEVIAEIPAEARAPEWGDKPRRRYEPAIVEALLRHTRRPVYFTNPRRLPLPWRTAQAGLLFRAVRRGDSTPARDYWSEYRWRNGLDAAATRGDETAELIFYEYRLARAREAFSEERHDDALRHIETGLGVYGREVQTLNNAGALCAEFRERDAARRYFLEALAREPGRAEVVANLERLHCLP